MVDLDQFFFRSYDAHNYNCAHFAAEVYQALTGKCVLAMVTAFCSGDKKQNFQHRNDVERIEEPSEPCFVWFCRPGDPPHVGVYVNHGVMHIQHDGVMHQPVRDLAHYFKQVKFYRCPN